MHIQMQRITTMLRNNVFCSPAAARLRMEACQVCRHLWDRFTHRIFVWSEYAVCLVHPLGKRT